MSDNPEKIYDREPGAPLPVERTYAQGDRKIDSGTGTMTEQSTSSSDLSPKKGTARRSRRDGTRDNGSMPDIVDEASDESFPASDAPASHRST